MTGLPGGQHQNNAYTGPGDAVANHAFTEFPRLQPYTPLPPRPHGR